MAKSIHSTSEKIQEFQALTNVMGLQDLNIVGQEISEDEQEIILFCVPKFVVDCCPKCGNLATQIHDYPEQRTIHDAPLRGTKTYLVFDVHRLRCEICQQNITLRIRDVVQDCTYTHRLATLISQPKRKQSVQTLADVYGVGYKTAESIIHKAGEDKLQNRKENPIEVKRLGIDEISKSKGQGNYILVLTDLERRIVLEILPDRSKSLLKTWLEQPTEGISLEKLSSVAIDMWRSYRDGVREVFGEKVEIIADRFHVMQNLHEAIHKARRFEQEKSHGAEEAKQLKGLRYVLLKKDGNLTEKDKERLLKLEATHPNLYQLTRLRQKMYEWYECVDKSPEEMALQLEVWVEEALKLGYDSMVTFCKTIKNWHTEIVAFFYIESQVGLLKV